MVQCQFLVNVSLRSVALVLSVSVTTVKVRNANAGNAVSHLCALRSPISFDLIWEIEGRKRKGREEKEPPY